MASFPPAAVSETSPYRAWGASGPHYHWWITAALMLGFTTAGLSITVVTLAFPKIMTSLQADLDQMQWVQTGYMIVQAIMMPSVAWLGSYLGNRRLYLISLGGFVGGSILCGMAWDIHSLIVFRLLQAMCAGPMFPISMVILFQNFPEEKRGLAMGVSSLGFSFGPMIGPVLGGYLLEQASWRAVFYINVPVGIIGLIFASFVLPLPQQQERRRLDIIGLLTMATFLVTFLLAMSQGREEGWGSSYILTLFAVAFVAGVSFVMAELHSPEPFVELRLYKNFAFAMASLVVCLNTAGFMATNFIITLFLQLHLNYTPLQVAWMLLPSAVVVGVVSVVSGRLSDLVPAKFVVIFGLSLVAVCLWQYVTITTWTSVGMLTFLLTARGFARAFTMAPLSAASLAPLTQEQLRMGSALLSLNRGIASATSVALAATVLQNRLAIRAIMLVQDQSTAAFGQDELLRTFMTTFVRLGDISQLAAVKALALSHRFVNLEAALHSYHDMFILLGSVAAVGIVPALCMGKQRAGASHASPPKPKPAGVETVAPTEPQATTAANGSRTDAPLPRPKPSHRVT